MLLKDCKYGKLSYQWHFLILLVKLAPFEACLTSEMILIFTFFVQWAINIFKRFIFKFKISFLFLQDDLLNLQFMDPFL